MTLAFSVIKCQAIKGLLHPKKKILSPCRSKPEKALFVFRTQFKIFWMKTGRLVDCPIDCIVNTTVKAQKSMKNIVRIVHLPSVVQSEFNEAKRTHFLHKKLLTLFNNSSSLHPRRAILENIRSMQIAYAVLCQPHHKDTFSTL